MRSRRLANNKRLISEVNRLRSETCTTKEGALEAAAR